MRGIAGKMTLITGGIRGIGKGIARRFVEEGAQVIVTGSKDVENARKTVEELSKLGKIESYMADLSDAGAIDKMIDDVVKKYGRIDILINNAGIQIREWATEFKVEDFDKVLGASNLSMLRYEWVWYKSRCTGFLNARRAPLKKTENILVFYQKLPLYNPQFEQGKPYKKIAGNNGNSTNYGKFTRSGSGSEDGLRFPGNVLTFPAVQRTVHPTQKPVALCEYFIKTYTRPGELVADICAGSGTTAVAALNTGRRFLCFETVPAYYAAASERIRVAGAAVEAGEKGV